MMVRPQFWGFFILDLERAFAFYWTLKACLLLGGFFLLLMLLTGSDFGVSLLGAAWVFFSGFMQWWYSSPAMLPETVGCVALLLVSLHYLALSSRRWVIAAAALVSACCLLGSVLSLYPPFQVPLFYLGIAILVGSLAPRLTAGPRRGELAFRASCAALALAAVAAALAVYYRDAEPAIELMRGTVYPGSRISSGGDLTGAQAFGGFFGFLMSEGNFPRKWLNVCEASNFVLLFPVPLAALLLRARRGSGATALEWSLIVYLVVVLAWITVGWPHMAAVATGFGWSKGTRSLLGLGLASILLCCVFLARSSVDLPSGLGRRLAVAAGMLTIAGASALDFNRVTGGFGRSGQIVIATLVAVAAGYFLLARKRLAFAACVLVPNVLCYGLVNPLASGLGPILETRLFREVSRMVDEDPDARWTVYGGYVTADLVKAAGAQVFNGTKFVPPLDDLRVIDPSATAALGYNRYAHIALVPENGNAVTFTLLHEDSYVIRIDPKSDVWRRLGIRYVALPFAATDPEFLERAALALELPDASLWVYRYRWNQGKVS